jgi:enamine deaminase RidA (YjgF/YER057c/UK114 family)
MDSIAEIRTTETLAPLKVFSQAIKANGKVFCSGDVGIDKDSWKLVKGGNQGTYCIPDTPSNLGTDVELT